MPYLWYRGRLDEIEESKEEKKEEEGRIVIPIWPLSEARAYMSPSTVPAVT